MSQSQQLFWLAVNNKAQWERSWNLRHLGYTGNRLLSDNYVPQMKHA
jgi:hypothetical protein